MIIFNVKVILIAGAQFGASVLATRAKKATAFEFCCSLPNFVFTSAFVRCMHTTMPPVRCELAAIERNGRFNGIKIDVIDLMALNAVSNCERPAD